jgi:metal-dependent amidase/aminoacylase/carboxypeptidase family protein
MNAETTLDQGSAILASLLEPQGFSYERGAVVREGAEEVARGAFARAADGRRLDLAVVHTFATETVPERCALRDVTYRVGGFMLAHDAYMAVVLGEEGSNQYPSFGGQPLDAFRHLRHDLECYATAFLRGPEAHFKVIVERAALWSRGMWSPRALFRT